MANTLRVKMSPLPAPSATGARRVSGAVLELEQFGADSTAATPSPQPAVLTFHALFMKGIRNVEARDERKLGQLRGELALSGSIKKPVFTIPGPSALVLDVPPDAATAPSDPAVPPDPRRILRLEFSSRSFAGTLDGFRLRLPEDARSFEHLELGVELELGGQPEAAKEQNDVLDVPLRFNGVQVEPSLCLDTPVDDPADHNLALLLRLPKLPAGQTVGEVVAVLLDGSPLEEGPEFFQDAGRVFFRTPAKPNAEVRGLVITKDEQAFDFVVRVATTPRERMDSLRAQIDNANALCDAAAGRADKSALVRGELSSRVIERKVLLLDSIEGMLSDDQELAEFYSRAGALPAVVTA